MGLCAVDASPTSLGSMQTMPPAAPSGQKQRYSHLLRIAANSSHCSGRRALSSGIVQPSSPPALLGLTPNATAC
eukprot:8602484-Heterocapsa_arctica.AAC.1